MSQAIPGVPLMTQNGNTMGSSINYNTVMVADQSHRGSFVDSSGFIIDGIIAGGDATQGNMSLEHPANSNK